VGAHFILVGEPLTDAKAAVIAAAGAVARSHYAMVEAGMIGLACQHPCAPDDVHLVSDKVATIERERLVGGTPVRALLHTTLLTASPKVMLNVESGDYGVLEERDCGCTTLPEGFRRHLHDIRSYEKLTGEGMHFIGTDLLCLLESILPARFGGHPTDYQLVERERDGITRVALVVSPSVGPLDAGEVVEAVLAFLRQRGVGQQLMAEVWANGATLEVERAAPHVTAAGKIQPLRKLGAG
jgi:phenylacetate-coenzyme A ligase PaaK-like adenylate-forming protein